MAEAGIDISRERPKKLDIEMQPHADWAITLDCGRGGDQGVYGCDPRSVRRGAGAVDGRDDRIP